MEKNIFINIQQQYNQLMHRFIFKHLSKIVLSLFILLQSNLLSFADTADNNNFSDLFTENQNKEEHNNTKQQASYRFYNENQDITDGIVKKDKNYAKIGTEEYSQNNVWKRYYVGVDIYWQSYGFGDGQRNIIAHTNFWRRFQNLNVSFGARVHKFFGVEVGYTFFGNLDNKYGEKQSHHSPFLSVIFYTPSIDLKYTSINGYISTGGNMLFSTGYNWKPRFAGKIGAGVILTLYGNLAFTAGVDYYTPIPKFNNKGFVSIKTGFSFYLS